MGNLEMVRLLQAKGRHVMATGEVNLNEVSLRGDQILLRGKQDAEAIVLINDHLPPYTFQQSDF